MREWMRHDMLARLLLLALTLAFITLGAGHRMAVPDTAQDQAALAAFVASGGTLADLCRDGGEGKMGKGTAMADDCPVCHLTASACLPAQTAFLRDAELVLVATVISPRESRAVTSVRDPAHGLRAPPALI